MALTAPRGTEFTVEVACRLIRKHHSSEIIKRCDALQKEYDGNHDILGRQKRNELANNKLVINHPKYISDTATGYFMGNPVTYDSEQDITDLKNMLKKAKADVQDTDLALNASIYGRAFEFLYVNEKGEPHFASLSPKEAFVVYDDTVEQKPLAGIYYYPLYDSTTDSTVSKLTGYHVYLSTPNTLKEFVCDTNFVPCAGTEQDIENGFGGVQIIEYYNNKFCKSDFEGIVTLSNAYNSLQSDRVNDKEQFVDAILLIKGQTFGDTNDEKGETYRAVKDNGLLELDSDGSAEWLTRQLDESSVEVLKKSIKDDIHEMSCVPNMNDECFSGNVTGVAMKYKLFGFEQITKIKERYFREGLQERLMLLCKYLKTIGKPEIDSEEITIQFTRSLPVNEVEIAQVVNELRETVPQEILLAKIPFIDDPKAAAKLMDEQRKAEQAAMFNTIPQELTADEQ